MFYDIFKSQQTEILKMKNTNSLIIRLPDGYKPKLKAHTALLGLSMNEFIGDLIIRYFKEDKRELQ